MKVLKALLAVFTTLAVALTAALLLSACARAGTADSTAPTGDTSWSNVTTTGAFGDATIESPPMILRSPTKY